MTPRKTLLLIAAFSSQPAYAERQAHYEAALQIADQAAQSERERLAPVDVGIGDSNNGRGNEVIFYSRGSELESVSAELVAIYDDTNGMCIWGHDTDVLPELPRTAALTTTSYAEVQNWPTQATDQWSSTRDECDRRTNLATAFGVLEHIQPLAMGPFIVYFGLATTAPPS